MLTVSDAPTLTNDPGTIQAEQNNPLLILITRFMPLVFFYTPWKNKKISGFLMFSGRIERDQWSKLVNDA